MEKHILAIYEIACSSPLDKVPAILDALGSLQRSIKVHCESTLDFDGGQNYRMVITSERGSKQQLAIIRTIRAHTGCGLKEGLDIARGAVVKLYHGDRERWRRMLAAFELLGVEVEVAPLVWEDTTGPLCFYI